MAPRTVSEALSTARRPTAREGGSWRLPAPEGVYARVVAWDGPAGWLDAVMDHLSTAEGDELRRRISIRASTLLRFAAAEAEAAHRATGRDVATSHATLAAACEMSVATARRCRQWLILAGFCEVVAQGRYLTGDERAAAEAQHGGRQLRAASTRALTQPRKAARDVNEHLPRRGELEGNSSVLKVKTTRAHARATAAARPQLRTRKAARGRADTSPRSLATIRLAAKLDTTPDPRPGVRCSGWLTQGRHIGALWRLLDEQLDTSRYAWLDEAGQLHVDADDIRNQINAWHAKRGIDTAPRGSQRDRLAYFRWQLQQAIDPKAETRVERVRRQKFEREEAQRAADIEQKRRERAASTSDAVAEMEAFFAPYRQQKVPRPAAGKRFGGRLSDPVRRAQADAELDQLRAAQASKGDGLANSITEPTSAHTGEAAAQIVERDRGLRPLVSDVVVQNQLGVDVDVADAVGLPDACKQHGDVPDLIVPVGGQGGGHVHDHRVANVGAGRSWIDSYREAVRTQLVEQLLRENGEIVPGDESPVEQRQLPHRVVSHEQQFSTTAEEAER